MSNTTNETTDDTALKTYTDKDYLGAIDFALNYPPGIQWTGLDTCKDIYYVRVKDADGWYNDIELQGSFVRSCLKFNGKKEWRSD